MIDTHCHLDVVAFDDDRDAAIARATAAGVIGMLIPAIRPRMWPALAALATRHAAAGVRIAIGVHPQIVPELDADELGTFDVDAYAETLATAARTHGAIAIGECGLDGGTADMPLQEALFRAHLRAARATGLPAVIHVLRAHDAAPRILREERCTAGVMHSYSGGADLVGVYRDLGLAFSFAGPVTYANARKPIEAARIVPADLLLAETDAPDQAPEAHRGSRSEPAYVAHVIDALARARDVGIDEMTALTTANAQRIFASWL